MKATILDIRQGLQTWSPAKEKSWVESRPTTRPSVAIKGGAFPLLEVTSKGIKVVFVVVVVVDNVVFFCLFCCFFSLVVVVVVVMVFVVVMDVFIVMIVALLFLLTLSLTCILLRCCGCGCHRQCLDSQVTSNGVARGYSWPETKSGVGLNLWRHLIESSVLERRKASQFLIRPIRNEESLGRSCVQTRGGQQQQ